MWTAPKVNWKQTDFYNIEDWQRVRSNLEHVLSWMLNAGFSPKPLLDTDTGRGYAELPYVHLVNNMEVNLASLQETFGVSFTEDVAQKTWYGRLDMLYSSNPTYRDWNRWEIILQRVYESIQYIDTYVFTPISGTCCSGSERTLIRFSRGR
jgi:hypothetical protein